MTTPEPPSEFTVEVVTKSIEATDIALFELALADGSPLPPFSAGSHIDVQIPGGFTRQYSLCNHPAETDRYLIGVLRDPSSRGGSIALHDDVNEGDLLTISAPRNHFPLQSDAAHSVLLAGGIGVTPILCMAEQLGGNASFEMHYCTRSLDRTAFRTRLANADFGDRVHHHFDDAGPEQALDIDGLIANAQPDTHLYVCGPSGFMDWVMDAARQAQWPEDQLHYEFFSANAAPSADDADFEVELATSGVVITVERDQTVVAALADVGITIPMSCEQGVCGTCLTRVIDGVPDHKDLYLMPAEQEANDQFLPCCSRSLSPRLVLDL